MCMQASGVADFQRTAMMFVKPSHSRVQEHTKNIAWNKEFNKVLRYTAAACAGGLGCYFIYSIWGYATPAKSELEEVWSNAELTQQLKELKGIIQAKNSGQVVSFVRSVIPHACVSLAPVIITKLFQEQTIEEYVAQKTRMWQTFSELIQYAHDFDVYKKMFAYRAEVYERLVPISYKNLVDDLEHVIGYMRYISNTLTVADKQQDAYHVTHLLFVASGNFCNDLAKIVVNVDAVGLEERIKQFKHEVEKLISTFAKLEQDEKVLEGNEH